MGTALGAVTSSDLQDESLAPMILFLLQNSGAQTGAENMRVCLYAGVRVRGALGVGMGCMKGLEAERLLCVGWL